ncbi:hypothetical protein PTSG_09088 [Salpingoeca rosetta]|uniref:SHOCT domain-containing protein n=1 Tax=Salpingoeca rosetta (strain ATCC 50818 / BSB-021) TaxID=946362 RepID=F2UM64_SALR5|nr:uncharacterized protein PTSG_09088 [Salpingoeca rosetta]EGD78213.1 hypothetical protein PTSG_09088 [Salpingoeca rosetta]|eukprot:XP_004989889.1 hypothetical protein PTSG_09088 [Salpingoeca rosetta]
MDVGNPDLSVDDRMSPGSDIVSNPCLKCMYCCGMLIPKVRGIPADAKLLSLEEQNQLLAPLQGAWKLRPLESGRQHTIMYTDIYVEGPKVIMSGGMHNRTRHVDGRRVTAAVANRTQVMYIKYWRGSDGVLYIDRMGSIVESFDQLKNELRINNALGISFMWYRENTVTSQPVVAVQPSISDELEKLVALLKGGHITQEEYDEAKQKVLAH